VTDVFKLYIMKIMICKEYLAGNACDVQCPVIIFCLWKGYIPEHLTSYNQSYMFWFSNPSISRIY